MNSVFEAWLPDEPAGPPVFQVLDAKGTPMLTPHTAWRILKRRTGVNMCRATFYRWMQTGRVIVLRMGNKIYVPWPELEGIIREFRNGGRI